jgi:hypothetical protein
LIIAGFTTVKSAWVMKHLGNETFYCENIWHLIKFAFLCGEKNAVKKSALSVSDSSILL